MDSVTQIVLGASVAAVCVPNQERRKAIVIGAALGTLPDLDVLIDYGDAVSNFTYHRGFSHSLFVLFPLSIAIWAVLKRFYQPVATAPLAWFYAISLALITHPLLDAHTVYGTQLFWPLDAPPVMWSTIFIIDPLYTLPLLIGVLAVVFKPNKTWANKTLKMGLFISCIYLVWTWGAKTFVDRHVQATVQNGQQHQFLSIATPFNTLVWRVIVKQNDQYLVGYYSLLNPEQNINYTTYRIDQELLRHSQNMPSVQQLEWFSHGFNKYTEKDDKLVISDLRMGIEGYYVFNHVVAQKQDSKWHEIKSEKLPSQLNFDNFALIRQQLSSNTDSSSH